MLVKSSLNSYFNIEFKNALKDSLIENPSFFGYSESPEYIIANPGPN